MPCVYQIEVTFCRIEKKKRKKRKERGKERQIEKARRNRNDKGYLDFIPISILFRIIPFSLLISLMLDEYRDESHKTQISGSKLKRKLTGPIRNED
jgi:hypothetical protein